MEFTLFYSDKCNFSNILKNFDLFDKLNKITINTSNDLSKVPNYITEVPILLIKDYNNKTINILKNDELYKWFLNNSNNNSENNNLENNNSKDNNIILEDNNTILESNQLNSNFSNNFTYLEDNPNIDYAENYYSNIINSDNNNNNNNSNNNNNNNNKINNNNQINNNNIKEEKKKNLDSDYENFIKNREMDFKPIQRI